jgi:4-diphosphocytidyl-2-C-methyl-D-erythritol kinase
MVLVSEFAAAKVNLALHVLGRRADGFHELDSIVAFADIGDKLTLEIAEQTSLQVDGPFAPSVPTTPDNLVLKAHVALSAVVDIPNVKMRLTKNLPVASGIGGGSADAAAALRGLLKLADVTLNPDKLCDIALSLGADVPVCLFGKACHMRGVGDVITALDHLPFLAILLVNPLQACSTKEVFRGMGLEAGDRFGSALDASSPGAWRNDMTDAALQVLPAIAEVLSALQNCAPHGVVRMSGSGATCFSLFPTIELAEQAATAMQDLKPRWWVAAAQLS